MKAENKLGKTVKQILKDDLWVILLDIVAVNLSYFIALVLRGALDDFAFQGTSNIARFFSFYFRFAPVYTFCCLVIFYLFRLYGGLWRYASINDINRIIGASVVSCLVQIVASLIVVREPPYYRMPITYYCVGAALQFVFISAIRFSYRIVVIEKRRSGKKLGRALVIGMGELGEQTIRVLQDGVYFNVCCVVDPKGVAAGRLIDGIPVYGLDELTEQIEKHEITCVFLTEPGLSEGVRKVVKHICQERKVELRDYSSFFGYVGESDQFTGMGTVAQGPQQKQGSRKIPFSPPDIGESEIAEVVDALNSGWITTGPRTKLLERRLAAYIETGKTDIDTEVDPNRWKDRVVCLNSATAAEELNLRILGIGPGDEVIVPAYSYTASASAAIHCGATVKFVDIQKDGDAVTHMPEMDYEALEAAITERTKAIVPVDLGGIVCDYDRIFEIVERKKGLFTAMEGDGTPLNDLSTRIQKALGRVAVVCDAAHALGASRVIGGERRYVGAIADFTSFSFHAVKNFTTAEGGASTWRPVPGVENAEIYRMFQLLSLHGQNKDALAKTKLGAWEYDIIGPWYKCNMTDIMAAIGLRQLDRYPGLLDRRVQIMQKYDAVCDELGISHLVHHVPGMDSSNHLYLIRIPGIDVEKRNEIIERMAMGGVATNVHYKPMPMMTAYNAMSGGIERYPNSFDYYHNLITLPLHTRLSDEDVAYVCEALRSALKEMRA